MGYLVSGGSEYAFDDRTLAHLKAVIGRKLRRQESFFLSWTKPAEEGGGRVSLWLSPSSSMAFLFSGSRPPALNETWLKVLSLTSQTARGLIAMNEKEAEKYAKSHPEIAG